MYSLFIDTHNSSILVALTDGKTVIKSEKESNFSHSKLLLPTFKTLLNNNKISLKDINEIIVVNGPGSFTGIRIGLSVAKTLAYCLNIPIKPISSLTAYLVSNISDNKLAIIEENKGYYISAFDKDNNQILEEQYLKDIEEYKSKYNIVKNELNILQIYNYSKNLQTINSHLIKANYIKKIEVEK